MYVGVDVGTASVRAAVFDASGNCINKSVVEIDVYNPKPDYYEQSSQQIWTACVKAIKDVVNGIEDSIRSFGFDATSSVAIFDKHFKPLPVNPERNSNNNVIMWLDHRALKQTEKINATNHKVLRNVGGKMSIEMQTPKLMWIKENLPDIWQDIGYCFDVSDFLTWRATGCDWRSSCSLVFEWTYQKQDDCLPGFWDRSYFEEIGLMDILDNHCVDMVEKLPGEAIGKGLSPEVAKEMGLKEGISVSASIIDAFAGAVGALGCDTQSITNNLNHKLVLLCGTSCCHVAANKEEIFVSGVWGPYRGIIPGYWMHCGGQSASGKLVDYLIDTHPASKNIKNSLVDVTIFEHLEGVIEEMCKKRKLSNAALLTRDFHVYPDFHGNRSPLADATLRGMISGLSLDDGVEHLALVYLATIQALAYSSRHIVDSMRNHGYDIRLIVMCGGSRQSSLWVRTHADALGMPVVLPREPDSVLLGSAMLGSVAAGDYPDVESAMMKMGGSAHIISPDTETLKYHNCKYAVFLKMLEDQKSYKALMTNSN